MPCWLAPWVACSAGWHHVCHAVLAGTVCGLQCWLAPCVACGADWHHVCHAVLTGTVCGMWCWLAPCMSCSAGWHRVWPAVLAGTMCGVQCWLASCVLCGAGWHCVWHAVLASMHGWQLQWCVSSPARHRVTDVSVEWHAWLDSVELCLIRLWHVTSCVTLTEGRWLMK